jgi:hypothetical protein
MMPLTINQSPHPGAPPGYDELHAYFAQSLDAALGVSRDTIRKWNHHQASRVRRDKALRVAVLLSACREAEALMHEPRAVGLWMLTPQPLLRGAMPARILVERGPRGLPLVKKAIHGVIQPGSLDDEAIWRDVEENLPASYRSYLKRVRETEPPDDVDMTALL